MSRVSTRPLALAVAAVLVAVATTIVGSSTGAGAIGATWVAPTFDRMISGPSKPGIAAWGLVYNPVTDEFVVGDYISNQIRRFDRDGRYLGDFTNPSDQTDSIISAVAVDPNTGAVYAAATSLTSPMDIRKYDSSGNFLFGFDVPGRVAWLTVDDDGHVWFPQAYGSFTLYQFAVNDATQTATQLTLTGTKGNGVGQSQFHNGVDAAANGDIYIVDGVLQKVLVFGQTGAFKFEFTHPSISGDLRGIAVDDVNGLVYVSDARGADIEVFTLAGAHVRTIAEEGEELGQFASGARQLTTTPDGMVWGADYSAFRVQGFLPDGTFANSFPSPGMDPDPQGLVEPWGVGIDPADGDVVVADHWGQRINRFTATGELESIFGRRGRKPESGLNYPRSVAVDPDTGNVWVMNAEGQPWLVVYTPDWVPVLQIPTFDLSTGLELRNGEAYVAYRGKGIEVFDMETGVKKRGWGQVGPDGYQGIGVDPVTGNMWVPIRDKAKVLVLRPNGTQLATVTVGNSPTDVAFRAGVAYVTDTGANRIYAVDAATRAALGSFGTNGIGPGQISGPKGIDVGPDGKLYVVEVRNARVQVFDFDGPGAAETNKPSLTLDSPANGAATATTPVEVTGMVGDDSGVASVEIQVRNVTRDRYWNAKLTTWVSYGTFNPAIFEGDQAAGTWSFTIVPAQYDEQYEVKVRAYDVHGNVRYVNGTFTVDDEVAPEVTVTAPAAGATVPPSSLAVSGSVADDGLITGVEFGLVNGLGEWWDPATGWTTETWFPASTSGTTSPVSFSGGLAIGALADSGPYELRVRATDSTGNTGSVAVAGIVVGPDTVEPDSQIAVPTKDQQLSTPAVLSGTATDGSGVARLEGAVMNRATGQWWNATTATWGAFVWNDVPITTAGGTEVTWSWTPNTGPGDFFLQTRAIDVAGNVESSRATSRYSVVAGVVDSADPDTMLHQPSGDVVLSTPVQIFGGATDDVGVAAVEVAVKDRATNLWWNQSTMSWGAFHGNTTVLGSPGATSTFWGWEPSFGPGDYYVQARAVDTAGKVDASRAATRFSVA